MAKEAKEAKEVKEAKEATGATEALPGALTAVTRGADWYEKDQDGGEGSIGYIVGFVDADGVEKGHYGGVGRVKHSAVNVVWVGKTAASPTLMAELTQYAQGVVPPRSHSHPGVPGAYPKAYHYSVGGDEEGRFEVTELLDGGRAQLDTGSHPSAAAAETYGPVDVSPLPLGGGGVGGETGEAGKAFPWTIGYPVGLGVDGGMLPAGVSAWHRADGAVTDSTGRVLCWPDASGNGVTYVSRVYLNLDCHWYYAIRLYSSTCISTN